MRGPLAKAIPFFLSVFLSRQFPGGISLRQCESQGRMSTGGTSSVAEMKRQPGICYRRKSGARSTAPGNNCCLGSCCSVVPRRRRIQTLPSSLPLRFLEKLRDWAMATVCTASFKKRALPRISSLEKSTASSDSHRSESVEACIQYINSSSSSSSQSESKPNINMAVSESK